MFSLKLLQPSPEENQRSHKFEEIETLRQRINPDWDMISALLDEVGETLAEAQSHAQELHMRRPVPFTAAH